MTEEAYKCSCIDKVFHSQENLNLHMDNLHAQMNEETLSYLCEKCNFIYKTKERFTVHLSGMQHNRVEKETEYDDVDSDSDDEEEYLVECNHCKTVLKSYDETDDHHSNYLRCEKCKVCFHNEFQWDEHEECDIWIVILSVNHVKCEL